MSRGSAANSSTGASSSVKRVRFGQKSRKLPAGAPAREPADAQATANAPPGCQAQPAAPTARPGSRTRRHPLPRPPCRTSTRGAAACSDIRTPPLLADGVPPDAKRKFLANFTTFYAIPAPRERKSPPGGSHATWGYAPASRRRSPAAPPPQRKAHDFWPQIAESDAGCPSGKHAPAPLSRRR